MKKVEPKTLSGFMELMPKDQVLFNHVKNTIQSIYESYGFYPLDTPIIEDANVLLAKAGGETEKQIYAFKKGDNDLALRFDLTVPLAKYVAARYNDLIFPFKRYQIGKVYRGERPQKGRFRELYQSDIDVIGNESLSLDYDALMPKIIYDLFRKLDFGDFVVSLNNRKILSGFFINLGLSNNIVDILRIIDKLDKIGLENVKLTLKDLNISDDKINKICEFININGTNKEIIHKLRELKIENEVFNLGIDELEYVINSLYDYEMDDKYFTINLTIARGLDYYTGTVYETKLVDYPSIGSICSGGRYDNLAEYYTDQKLPGVGISIGLTRLFDQLLDAGLIKDTNEKVADVIVLPMTDNFKYINKYEKYLRDNNFKVDTVYVNKFKSAIKYASRQEVKYALIIGDDEVSKNTAVLKNMYEGTQEEVTLDNILDKIIVDK